MTKLSLDRERNFWLTDVMKLKSSIGLALLISFGGFGIAQAETKLRGDIFCFPAEDVPKLVKKLGEVDDSRRNIVDVSLKPKFLIKDGGTWPERFFIRTASGEIDVPIEKPSGATPSFLEAAINHSEGDVCVADKARANRPEHDEGLYFEMGLSPLFHNRSGRHDLAELKEGTKDGKSFYKKMIPAAVRMFMPDTKYLAVRYDDFRTSSQIFASINGAETALQPELYKDMHVLSYKELEALGAQALIIKGGGYQLQPTVGVKTMKRFGWGEDTDESDNKN